MADGKKTRAFQFSLQELLLLVVVMCLGIAAILARGYMAIIVLGCVVTLAGCVLSLRHGKPARFDAVVIGVLCVLSVLASHFLYQRTTKLGPRTIQWGVAITCLTVLPAIVGFYHRGAERFAWGAVAMLLPLGIAAVLLDDDEPQMGMLLWAASVMTFVGGKSMIYRVTRRKWCHLFASVFCLLVGGFLVVAVTCFCLFVE